MPLLSVKDLSITFKHPQNGDFCAVKNVNFSLNEGETLALVGESGSGKSVTALSILGLLPPFASITGERVYDTKPLHTFKESDFQTIRGKDIAMVFQEPMTALNPLHTIQKQIAEPILTHFPMTQKQTRARVLELLHLVGFDEGKDRLNAYPHELSGGQRQRVMIAMALACQPKILIADEPTTALDVTIQAGIIKLLQKLQDELKMALILITHDLGMVQKFAHNRMAHMAVMQQGKIVEYGEIENVLTHPKHAYTKRLIEAEPTGSPAPLLKNAPILLKAKDIRITFGKKKSFWSPYARENHAVQGVSLDVKQGETLGVVGESGSGKSTLGYGVLRLLGISYTGSIVYQGQDLLNLKSQPMRALRRDLQIIFQDPFSSLNPRFTCAQSIGEGLFIHEPSLNQKAHNARIQGALLEVGLDESFMMRYPHELSGGQRQRVCIARALILRPKMIVLDEPTSALDRSIQGDVIHLLRGLQEKYGLSYIFISHDLKVVRAMSHRIMVMQGGKVVEVEDTETLFKNPKHAYTRELLNAVV